MKNQALFPQVPQRRMALSKSKHYGIQKSVQTPRNAREDIVKTTDFHFPAAESQKKPTNQTGAPAPNPCARLRQNLRPPLPPAETREPGILLKPQRRTRIHQLRNHSSQTQPERAAAAVEGEEEGRLKPGSGSAGRRRGHGHPGRPPSPSPLED